MITSATGCARLAAAFLQVTLLFKRSDTVVHSSKKESTAFLPQNRAGRGPGHGGHRAPHPGESRPAALPGFGPADSGLGPADL